MAIPNIPVIVHGRASLSSLRLETSFSSPDVPTLLLDTPLIHFYLFLCSTDWLIGSWGAFLLVFIRARELPCVRFSSSGLKHSRELTRTRQWKTDVTLLLARINFEVYSGLEWCADCLLSHLFLSLPVYILMISRQGGRGEGWRWIEGR